MKVIDLFPPCTYQKCPQRGTPHKHILPTQQELFDSKEKYIALIGGYGSGKTLGACVLGHNLSTAIPGNRGIVLRRSLPKLHDSTERIYLEVLKRSGVEFHPRENRDGWPHRIVYGNGSEVAFRETKDLGRFLGPEYGWFYIDEAQEEPEKTFKDLIGRLRLPLAASYLRGIIGTNPPSNQHWIAHYWPKPGAYRRVVNLGEQILRETFRMIRSSTMENPHLDPSYIAGLMLTHSASEVKRIIHGNYGFVQEGNPVYPQFDELKHIADPETFHQQVYRVWDFGFHQPAVAWSQIFRCKHGSWHLNFLFELEKKDLEAEKLAEHVLTLSEALFPHPINKMMVDGGDTAGAQLNDKGPGPIIRLGRPRSEGGFDLRFYHQKFGDINPGLDEVRSLLRKKCKCGFYLLTIHRRCKWIIEAMAGGYHMPAEKPGKDNQIKPVKDGYYDNIADVVRYTVLLFYKPLALGTGDIDWITEGGLLLPRHSETENPWAWMGT